MPRAILRLVADAVLVGTLLFAAAGTWRWGRAWALLAVLLVVRLAGAAAVHRVHPGLVRERAGSPLHRDQPRVDALLLLAVLGTGFAALPVVAACDVFRWRLLPRPAWPASALGLALFAAGWALKAVALRENAFATAAVRVQHERGHRVVDSGVYAVVRHPFYAGTVLVLVGMGLWLGSYAAVLLALVPIALLVLRIEGEERILRRELPGYGEYAAHVRHRLVPGIW